MVRHRHLIGKAEGFTRVEMDSEGNIYGYSDGPWKLSVPLITGAATEDEPAHAISAVKASAAVPALRLTIFRDGEAERRWLIPDICLFSE